MKKSLTASLLIHLLILSLFGSGGKGENGKYNADGQSPQKDENGHFLGQPKEKEIPVTLISKSDLDKLEKEHQKAIKKLRRDCGKDAYGGIGVRGIGNFEDTVLSVTEVAEGSPAQRAGILPGDILYSLKEMRGTPGTEISIVIEDIRGIKRNATLTRELICYIKGKSVAVPNS